MFLNYFFLHGSLPWVRNFYIGLSEKDNTLQLFITCEKDEVPCMADLKKRFGEDIVYFVEFVRGTDAVFEYLCMYVCMTLYLHANFFTDASLINVQLVSMRGVGIIRRTIYKNISNYKTIYKRIGVTLLVHKGNVNIHVIID